MKAIHYASFKLEEKATRGAEKDRNNSIKVIGDKITTGIRCNKISN